MRVLEDNVGENVDDLGYQAMTPKARSKKVKITAL